MTMTDRAGDRNNAAMRPQTLPDIDPAIRRLNEIIDMATRAKADIRELWQRVEQTSEADGYSSSALGSGVQSQSDDTTTETAALLRAFGHDMPDDVLSAVSEFEASVKEAHGALRGAERRRQFVFAVEQTARQRRSSIGECQACDRTVQGSEVDKLKSGFCWRAKRQDLGSVDSVGDPDIRDSDRSGCYDAWVRWQGRNENLGYLSVTGRREAFIAERQAYLKAEEEREAALEAEAQRLEQGKRNR